MSRVLLALAGIRGFLAVALGAFGAHALKAQFDAGQLQLWQTAVQYHFIHTLALAACAIWARHEPSKMVLVAGGLFAAGICLFSGSLYALALSGVRSLGAITPIGGSLWLVAWLLLAICAYRKPQPNRDRENEA